MMKIKVAIAQIEVSDDIAVNLNRIKCALAYAADQKADLLLTPEGSLSGYTHLFDVYTAKQALQEVESVAKGAGIGLALGTCMVEEDGQCYNELRFYEKDGTYLGCHTKTLRCGTMTEPPVGEINVYGVRSLRTFSFMGITIGGLICNDMWANPSCTPMPDSHLAHQLAQMGAKVFFHAVNGGRDRSEMSQVVVKSYHESNLRIRAAAEGIYIVTTDNAAPSDIPTSSYSGVVVPDGSWLCRLPDTGEQFMCAEICF